MFIGPETQLYRRAGHFNSERTGRHRCVYACTYICGLSTHASPLRAVQASQEDVRIRIQDGEEIAACVEDSLPTDSLALLCKMLPEKAETFMFNRLDCCAQVSFDLR